MTFSTHVLDASSGRPAAGVPVGLHRQNDAGQWEQIAGGVTDADGRLKPAAATGEPLPLTAGVHRIDFDTAAYFKASGTNGFYPQVSITFEVTDAALHYHVPLLLSPFAYSTYRGS